MTDAELNVQDRQPSEQKRQDEQRIATELAGLDRHTDPFVAAVHATRMPMIITNPRLPDNPVVFVGGLPAFIGEDTLRAMFGGFGEIVYVKVRRTLRRERD